MCGYIIRSLTLKEGHGLRKIFGLRTDEVTEEWRKLHKKEVYDLYPLPNIIV